MLQEILVQPHKKRHSFWNLVPEGLYGYIKGRELVLTYYNGILREIEGIVSSHSRMYWLHLSRRILPGTSGKNKYPITIGITRGILDGAYEKYGQEYFCDSIGITHQNPIEEVFDGLLMSDEFEYERKLLLQLPEQIVLTKFNQINYLEYYQLEKLAYEVWKCGAVLRILGKGANLIVKHDDDELFYDDRSEELSGLIDNYDKRPYSFLTSRKGVVLEDKRDMEQGKLLIPAYNTQHYKADYLNPLLKSFDLGVTFGESMIPNFLPFLYPLRGFFQNNKPLFDEFKKVNKVEVISILYVITSITYRTFHKMVIEKDARVIKPLLLRGYEGPFLEPEILSEIENYQGFVKWVLNITDEEQRKVDIKAGYEFLKLSDTKVIDLLFTTPVKMFIPVDEDRVLIDLAKISTILDDLMFGIRIDNENFKGDLFEYAVGNEKSWLPTNQCIASDNTKKQVDYAFSANNILVICECKLKEMSIGFYKGNVESINTRIKNVVIKSIMEIDDKAYWLARNPKGRNYDISQFEYILPVGLSGFKEFIHTKEKKFWINSEVPRVLTVEELKRLIDDKRIDGTCWNLIKINTPDNHKK